MTVLLTAVSVYRNYCPKRHYGADPKVTIDIIVGWWRCQLADGQTMNAVAKAAGVYCRTEPAVAVQ